MYAYTLDVLFCSKHDLWSDWFHNEYLMELYYIKRVFLHSCVVYDVNVYYSFWNLRALYIICDLSSRLKITTNGIIVVSWEKKCMFLKENEDASIQLDLWNIFMLNMKSLVIVLSSSHPNTIFKRKKSSKS